MMDIKAKTSYEAAKKFAKEKGLKSTAGVDTHLYPLEEGAMSDLHARIMSSDDPHEEINRLLTQDGPEGDYIRREYEITAGENGLHPDDDFEEILDAMVSELDNDNPFEGHKVLPNIDKERYTEIPGLEGPFQTMSGKPIYYDPKEGAYYDRDTDMYLTYAEFKALDDDYKGMNEASMPVNASTKMHKLEGTKHTIKLPGHYSKVTKFKSEGENKMGPQGIMPGDRVEHEGDMYEVVAVDGDILTVDNLKNGNRTQFRMDDVTRLFGMDAMTDQDKDNLDAMFKRLDKVGSGSLKHVATEGHSPHKKGTKKYKAHMAAMHANSAEPKGKMIEGVKRNILYREIGKRLAKGQSIDRIKKYYKDIDVKYPGHIEKIVQALLDRNEIPEASMNEGKYGKKKKKKKYETIDLHVMRNALKLDESTDANTVVAEYTRACLDLSHNTWGKVCEQIDHVRSFVKEDVDVENVKIQLRKMHEREALDRNILVKENIDKLRQIVKDKSAMSIKFADGTMKVDMTTANIFVQMYDRMKERNQKKIDDMMQTKAGFLKVLDFFYGAMK
jgi:hypothetical protein